MNEIRSLLAVARRRLETGRFIAALHLALLSAAIVALMLAVADRLPSDAFVRWPLVAPLGALVVLAAAVGLWSRGRPSELAVAMTVDERLELRERLSTALACGERNDPFAVAAVEDAARTARDPRLREVLSRRLAVEWPRRFWAGPLGILLAFGVLMLPQARLFADDALEADGAGEEQVVAAQVEAQDAVTRLREALDDKELLAAELEDALNGLEIGDAERSAPLRRPEDVRRDALKKVSELNRRLDELVEGEKGMTAEAVRKMMAQLKAPEEGLGKDLADALASGDFAEAQRALEAMQDALAEGTMSPEQKEALAQQLENVAEQLQQLAEKQEQLAEALKQAGLNPQLAANPDALQQALQQAQNLNQQQKQQLMQMAQAQQAAQQMCQGLGGACQAMAQAAQQAGQGTPGQAGEGFQQAMDQLNQMEALQQMLAQAQAMAGECQGACQGLGQGLGDSWKPGGGMGKRGQGAGGEAPMAPTPTGTTATKENAPVGPGQIIARTLVQGVPIRGESRASMKAVQAALEQGYDEALEEDPLPRVYHETLKHYFGELKEQVRAIAEEPAAAPADAPPASGDGG